MSIYNFAPAAASAGGSVFRIPTSQTTGTVTTTGVDMSGYTGNALFILWVTSSATGRSMTAKLQHCATATTGSYTDVTDGAFTAYTSAQTGLRHLALNADCLNKYVRLSTTVAGGAVVNGGLVEGWKNY
jgi:hypothetical protein